MFGGSLLLSQNWAVSLQYGVLENFILFQFSDWKELVEDFLRQFLLKLHFMFKVVCLCS